MARIVGLLLVLIGVLAPSHAEDVCKGATIEKTARLLAAAYAKNKMAILDRIGVKGEEVQFVIEPSITFDYEVEETKTFAQADRWLKSLELEEDVPTREARPLDWCRKGLCVFNLQEGVSHNTLYIHMVTYSYERGCPSLRTVFLLNGD